MKPTIYVSKRCGPCRKLLMMLQQRPHLKGHYQLVCIDDSPFPKAVKSVPSMIIDDTLVNSEKLFNYILNSDSEKNNGNNSQNQNEKTECSVDEISGVSLNDCCLNYSALDDTNLSNESYSFLNEESHKTINTTSEQSNDKRKGFDNDYERLMAERGELMSKPSFA